MFRIRKEFHFSASHQLTHLPPDHQCARLHGHNYIVVVELGHGKDSLQILTQAIGPELFRHLTLPCVFTWMGLVADLERPLGVLQILTVH